MLNTIPILLGVSLVTFFLMSMAPGGYLDTLSQNPQVSPETIARLKAQYNLDKPWYVQYFAWLKSAVRLDFGYSVQYQIAVTDLIGGRVWNTFVLSACAFVLAWLVAVPLGILAAVKRGSFVDRGSSVVAFAGLSIPEVLSALLALMFAAATKDSLGLPIGGAQSSLYDFMSPGDQFIDRVKHLILPVLVLASVEMAAIMRQMRSNLLDTLNAEYVTAARARGGGEFTVIVKHAVRTAINPLLTLLGYSLARLLSGAFIVENVMAWPGLGRLTMEAFFAKDYYLVVTTVVMAAGLLVVGNFIADVLLAWSDPRIRMEGKRS
tara:strand:- start:1360 stop:2322 length:963 start_codon:yes stop_codon:yes gene_type:complete